MTDAEVGALWRIYGGINSPIAKVVTAVISKLVEERANCYQSNDPAAPAYQNMIFPHYRELALSDFGIDAKEYADYVAP